MCLAVPPPRPLAGERTQLRSHRRVIVRDDRLVTLRGPMLTSQTARPPLGEPKPLLQRSNGSTPTGRAQKFPRDSSLSPWISSTWSATIRFNLAFSASSSFNRFTSSAFIPPNWLRHR